MVMESTAYDTEVIFGYTSRVYRSLEGSYNIVVIIIILTRLHQYFLYTGVLLGFVLPFLALNSGNIYLSTEKSILTR